MHSICHTCSVAGVIELLLTIMTLWTFGVHMARALKCSVIGVAVLYLVPGVVGALVSVNFATVLPSAGAPAAVCGLVGKIFIQLSTLQHCIFSAHRMCPS